MGIDPGLDGGIGIIDDVGNVLFHRKMPTKKYESNGKQKREIDAASLIEIIKKYEPEHVFLEKAQCMPKNGAVGMFNYGTGYGIIIGMALALNLYTNLVVPRNWQRLLGVDKMPGENPKDRAAHKFYSVFPQYMNKDLPDGIIDALLISEYGRRTLNLQ